MLLGVSDVDRQSRATVINSCCHVKFWIRFSQFKILQFSTISFHGTQSCLHHKYKAKRKFCVSIIRELHQVIFIFTKQDCKRPFGIRCCSCAVVRFLIRLALLRIVEERNRLSIHLISAIVERQKFCVDCPLHFFVSMLNIE